MSSVIQKMTKSLLVGALLGAPVLAEAVQVVTDDLSIEDGTPSLIFNDTTVLDAQYEWYIRGRDEYFSIVDVAAGEDVVYIEPSSQRIDLRYGVAIENPTPVLRFNDTTVADGQDEWIVRGRDESFSITDLDAGQSLLFFDKTLEAVSLGLASGAAGIRSIALGSETNSGGDYSIAMGPIASSAGEASTALGRGASSAGDFSTAVGSFASSAGGASTSLGRGASSAGLLSTALGFSAFSGGDYSTALGPYASSAGEASTAIGALASAPNPDTIILGQIPGVKQGENYVSVANGTTDPSAPLHIFRDDVTQEMLVLESNAAGGAQDRAMMFLVNNGGIRFEFNNPALSTAWRFQAATGGNDRFEVTKVGTGEIEYSFRANGNLHIAGNLFTNSDVNSKQDIVPVEGETILEKVTQLPLTEWSYRDAANHRHLGPMAQDFHAAFGLGEGETTISATDMAGVSLAAVQALDARNAELEKRVAELESLENELAELREQFRHLRHELAQH